MLRTLCEMEERAITLSDSSYDHRHYDRVGDMIFHIIYNQTYSNIQYCTYT